jgi:hypothetical protein
MPEESLPSIVNRHSKTSKSAKAVSEKASGLKKCDYRIEKAVLKETRLSPDNCPRERLK